MLTAIKRLHAMQNFLVAHVSLMKPHKQLADEDLDLAVLEESRETVTCILSREEL